VGRERGVVGGRVGGGRLNGGIWKDKGGHTGLRPTAAAAQRFAPCRRPSPRVAACGHTCGDDAAGGGHRRSYEAQVRC